MKIEAKLIYLVLVPMIIASLSVGCTAVFLSEKYLNIEQKSILEASLINYDGNVNSCEDIGVDITVFKGDTRIESSIENAVGTKASAEVIDKVLNGGQEFFDTNVDVNGESYFGYYKPTKDGMIFAGKSRDTILKNLYKLKMYIILIGAIPVIIFSLITILVAKYLANKIKDASNNVKRVASGDLSEYAVSEDEAQDEIHEMNVSIKEMIERLSSTIKTSLMASEKVGESSNKLSDTSKTTLSAMNEVSKAIEDIAVGLQGQSEAVGKMSSNIEDVNNDIESIKEFTGTISECSNKMNNSSENVKVKINEMLDSNKEVDNDIANISSKIKSITSVVDNVRGIASVIGDIASQTKLLSLNASIEASHANEYGKGFAVVAQSISELSENTSKEVKQITDIINSLVEDFNECVYAIQNTVRNSEIQKNDIYNVMEEFKCLNAVINETSEKVELIGKSVNKTAQEMNSISDEVNEIASIYENSAASTEEVNASVEEINSLMNGVANTAEDLKEHTDKLKKKFNFFKL